MVIDLEKLPAGKTALIVGLTGGRGLLWRLDGLGVHVGMKVRKLSSQFMWGPVTVMIGERQVAIGRGMARRIIVEAQD